MNHASRLSLLALSLCLPLACGDPPASEDDDDTPATTATTAPAETTTGSPPPPPMTSDSSGPPPATSTTGMEVATSSSSDGGESGPPVIFDFGGIPEAPPLDDQCGQVDFLFVIDNSGSMGGEQASLVANFPAFINGIQTVLETVDSYQVGVVTTDAYSYNVPGCNNLSSLVVQTGGNDSSNMMCGPYAEGNNYMTEMDDLATAFSCAAQVGTVGSASERAMQATVEAVTQVDGAPGQCNEGFIREDALLVIVIITDEPDNNSPGTPMTWYDDILAAKFGIPENVVVVSIINTTMGGCSGGTATDMENFTLMWGDNGHLIPICAPDYAPGFDDAVAIIDVACENYIPPN